MFVIVTFASLLTIVSMAVADTILAAVHEPGNNNNNLVLNPKSPVSKPGRTPATHTPTSWASKSSARLSSILGPGLLSNIGTSKLYGVHVVDKTTPNPLQFDTDVGFDDGCAEFLIYGVGGLEHQALQVAEHLDATVFAFDIRPEARQLALDAEQAFDPIDLTNAVGDETFQAVVRSLYGSPLHMRRTALDLLAQGIMKPNVTVAALEDINTVLSALSAHEMAGRTGLKSNVTSTVEGRILNKCTRPHHVCSS
ncbi:hypothetical protein C2E23DRAFT_880275 [Lenzites betulinus]|nr:hypothetical protein C2E23DRAFT_880275 [Lenzites betulinus]